MRVAIVAEVFLPKVDGVVIRTTNLIRRLLQRGDEVLVVCPQADGRSDCSVPTLEFRSFPFPAYPEYRIGIPDARLPRAISEFAPDVVHYVNPFAFGFRCYDFMERSGLRFPSVFSFHSLYGEFVKRYGLLKPLSRMLWWLTRDYHNRATTNLTVSTITQADLTQRGFERVGFWPPAVDSTLFHPGRADAEMRRRLSGGNPEDPLLVTVSRLAPEKNVALLADVLQQTPRARLAIIGDGPLRAELEQRFQGTNTVFVGYLKGEALAAAYASADAFIYASETETMGNVVLEAMASGLAVVAPRAGGIPSLLAEGESGLLYSPGDVAEASSQVRRLLGHDSFRRSLGEAARQSAHKCDWDHAADRVRQCYQQTIADHSAQNSNAQKRHRLAPAIMASLVYAFRAMATIRGQEHAAPNASLTSAGV